MTLAEQLAAWLAAADPVALSPATRETADRLLLDVTGLCVAARGSDYTAATPSGDPWPNSSLRFDQRRASL